jgi:GNAT superfamily N-acetyltransferase
VYRLSAAEVAMAGDGPELRRDAIEELLLYQPSSTSDPSRQEFLAAAWQRLEEGHHVYTWAAEGRLLHYSWLGPRTSSGGSDFGHEFRFPEPAVVLWDDYTRPEARGRGLQTTSLHRRVKDAAAAGETSLMIGVRGENRVSRHNIEKVGFRYWASGWARYRFGRVTRWITYADAEVPAPSPTALSPVEVTPR